MREGFEITWEADDGYCGGSRPHYISVDLNDFDAEDSEESLKRLFWDSIQSDFEQKVSPYSDDEAAFVAWAKEQQEKMRQEES